MKKLILTCTLLPLPAIGMVPNNNRNAQIENNENDQSNSNDQAIIAERRKKFFEQFSKPIYDKQKQIERQNDKRINDLQEKMNRLRELVELEQEKHAQLQELFKDNEKCCSIQ